MTRHTWPKDGSPGLIRLHGSQSDDGNDRTERTCLCCGLVKITVHPAQGLIWTEWRTKSGQTWIGETTPPCVERVKAKLEAAEVEQA